MYYYEVVHENDNIGVLMDDGNTLTVRDWYHKGCRDKEYKTSEHRDDVMKFIAENHKTSPANLELKPIENFTVYIDKIQGRTLDKGRLEKIRVD